MELLTGRDLAHVIPTTSRCRCAHRPHHVEVVGLDEAATQGVIHRDLTQHII